jgi:glyoxylase-like metal-dependent hydrolase (beta-lactamase superfamily II)
METRALTPQLTLLRFTVGQAYVWRDGDELTLVDTGPAGSGPDIAAVLAPLGRLRRIVLTHFHDDHAGSAAELATDGVQVLAHRADAPVIRGERPGPAPAFTPAERELHARVAAGLPAAPPARVDVELDEDDRLDVGGGATVLSVPGHTDGSIALHLPVDGVLFTGDLIAEWNGDVIPGPFNVDCETAALSTRRLAALSDVDIACFGHGEPLLGRAGDRLRPLLG